MSIEPGSPLLHYKVVEKIGAGGMGEVWRAVDTALDREVAIKVLPVAFAADPERLARFEREARLLASLNHPNIAAVYGLHESPSTGSGQGGIRFIAMELVGGEELSERLARGPLNPAHALEVAGQIAQGLSAAHEAGVIHRDLKPANVKIAEDGRVKILDFGLAKALQPGAASGDVSLTSSPTITSAGTMAGMILGTASYMSPEQARGRPTDRRTDLWSFGAMLYEMLAGRTPFAGEVISEIIAKILEREPDWDALPAPLHPGVRRLLERCLTKDPERRLRDAADARLDIEDLLADPTGERVSRGGGASPSVGSPPAPRRRAARLLPWAVAAAGLVWAVAATLSTPDDPAGRLVRFEINPPTGYQFAEFATAPDGSAVAFIGSSRDASRSLWVRRLDETDDRHLAGTEDAWFPFWSPDSRSVGFFSRGKLRVIDVASESIQTIADAPNGRGGAWGGGGTILFTPEGADVLYAVSVDGGEPRPVTTLRDSESTHRFPHFVGDTRSFTYSAHDSDSRGVLRRYVGALDSDRVDRLDDGMSETYAPPGYVLFVSEDILFAQAFDAGRRSPVGRSVPLVRDIDDTFPRTGRSSFSVSNNGVLMYLARRRATSRLDAYDRTGRRIETIVAGAQYEHLFLSGDGGEALFTRVSGGETTLLRMDIARASVSRLLVAQTTEFNVAWTPGDDGVVIAADGTISRMPIGGGEPETILDGSTSEQRASLNALTDPDASADGRFIAFSAWDPVSDFDLWILPLTGESVPRRISDATGSQSAPAISPDGCWVAYSSNESGAYEVYVTAAGRGLPDPGPCTASTETWLVSTGGGSSPVWSEDGRELYYVSSDYGIMALSITVGGRREFRAGLPVRLFDGPLSVEDDADIFFRAPELVAVRGDRFIFQVADEEVRDRTIEVVLGWERLLAD